MDHYADIEGMADRLVVGWQLDHGWTPRSILISHYDALLRHSKTASDANRYRQARDAVSGLGFLKFVYDLARQARLSLKDLVNLFKDSRVVRLFSKLKWNLVNLYKLLKDGYIKFKKLQAEMMAWAKSTWVGQKLTTEIVSNKVIDEWLATHPYTKMLVGAAVAGIFVYIFWHMSDTGNPAYDFNVDEIISALSGNYSISDLFTGIDGTKLAILLMTGAVGLSFPWGIPTSASFAIAVMITLARKLGKKMMKSKGDTEQEAKDLGLDDAIPGGV